MRTQGSAPATSGTIRRFNRDTVWLATEVLGTVTFAAVMIAVQECQWKAAEAESDLLLNANPATVASLVANTSNADGKTTPERGEALITLSLKLFHRKFLPHRWNPQHQLMFSR